MTRRITTIHILILFFAAALFSCAGLNLKTWSDRSPQEKAYSIMALYNQQYKDTMSMALTGDALTEEQKEVVRAKKKILTKVYPLIMAYVEYVDHGTVPSVEMETMILNYLNQLGGKI